MNLNGTVTIEVGPSGGSPSAILVLPVNPDQTFTQDWRTTPVQTWNGIYVDDWGAGIAQIELSGNTAFSVGQGTFNGQPVDGDTAARNLYYNILLFYFQREETESGTTVMSIYDDVRGRAWQVKPTGQLQLTQTSDSPVVVNYTQTFIILKDYITNAPQTTTTDPVKAIWQTTTSTASKAKSSVSKATSTAKSVKQTSDATYVVKSGDTLWTIAQKYSSVTATNAQIQSLVNQIVSLNGLKNPNLIIAGLKLKIPS